MTRRVEIDLPFIHAYTDRHGRRRFYYRRKGYPLVRLPAPGAPGFAEAYAAADKPVRVPTSKAIVPGSFGALCKEYEQSAEFAGLAQSTQREMRYVIRSLERKHADKPVALLERKHILKWRDELKDKPGAANKMIRVVKVLMAAAIDRGYRADDPSQRIKMLKLGEHRAWTADEMRAFEKRWPLGSLERTGYALALYTGQRRTDVARLKFASIAGKSFHVKQEKTGAVLQIPIHPELQKALAAIRPRSEAAIVAKSGRALNPIYFGHLMADAIEKAGLPDECVLHGLRKCAAVALIDAGCSPHEAAAITGHSTVRMLDHYAKRRDQAKLGKAAILKWRRARR